MRRPGNHLGRNAAKFWLNSLIILRGYSRNS
nr:MAG TPA: hypothetical protein [Caudoviricetes sp.]